MAINSEHDEKEFSETPALPGAPPAIRSEWQKVAISQAEFETDDADLNDISAIINGNKAITGKAVYSANQAGRNADQIEAQKADDKKREADLEEARELMHLAEWNGQMTKVGGVEMTNEEAQQARQHIIDNEDEYARRAVKVGRIRANEEEEYKATNRRIKELKDREGRGIASEAEKRECERLQKSRVGEATEHDAGEAHAQRRDQKFDVSTKEQNANSILGSASESRKDDLFQSAPKLTQAFADSTLTTNTSLPVPNLDAPAPAATTRDLKSTGLAI